MTSIPALLAVAVVLLAVDVWLARWLWRNVPRNGRTLATPGVRS